MTSEGPRVKGVMIKMKRLLLGILKLWTYFLYQVEKSGKVHCCALCKFQLCLLRISPCILKKHAVEEHSHMSGYGSTTVPKTSPAGNPPCSLLHKQPIDVDVATDSHIPEFIHNLSQNTAPPA